MCFISMSARYSKRQAPHPWWMLSATPVEIVEEVKEVKNTPEDQVVVFGGEPLKLITDSLG